MINIEDKWSCVYWEISACDGIGDCLKCPRRVGIDNPNFNKIRNKYDFDVENALAPIAKKYRELFTQGLI